MHFSMYRTSLVNVQLGLSILSQDVI